MEKTMMPRKILFLSDMCVLDPNSGAAISALAWMRTLTHAGYNCHSVSMSLFDGDDEFDMKSEFGLDINPREHTGSRIRFSMDGIEHNVFSVGTSRANRINEPGLATEFVKTAAEDIRRIKPDVVFGYGSNLLLPLRKLAGELGATRVFYLANASYVGRQNLLGEVDRIVCPSRSLADLYRNANRFECDVIWDLVPDYSKPETLTPQSLEARRNFGFVTMVNPVFAKGGMQFLQIANSCLERLPEARFLCLESRGTRDALAKHVTGLEGLKNIWWLPRQRDMSAIYKRTSILLVPSLWFEASARVIAEAQLCGIPVLVNDVGGTVEQLNGGGFSFLPPVQLLANNQDICPPEQIEPWLQTLDKLLKNEDEYLKACQRAICAAEPFRLAQREQDVLSYFKNALPVELAV